MLAAIDWLRTNRKELEFQAIGPTEGRLADALRCRCIPIVKWSVRDKTGNRFSPEQIQAELQEAIATAKPDLVHANSLAMSRVLGQISSRLNVPTTGHLRDIIKLSKAAIEDLNLNHQLIAVSHATRTFHVQQGLHDQRVTVVHNGIECDAVPTRSTKGWLAGELFTPLTPEPVGTELWGRETVAATDRAGSQVGVPFPQVRFIACIGQIGLRKGLDILAAAASSIVRQVPAAHFLLIGERTSKKDESIQFEKSIRQRFDNDGISSHVHWLGHREDVGRILLEVDLLIHPANQEPFGRVLLEASAAGLPIVATDVGGTSEIVINGQTGILVAPRDPQALAQAVVSLLSDPIKARRMGDAARQRTSREFTIEASASTLVDVWNHAFQDTLIGG